MTKRLLTLLLLACGMTTGVWASSIPGALSGRFTINASGEKVLFSQGNLQYQASTGTWCFAENQYDYIGSANSNISDSYTGWIDLFGWGTGNNPTLSSWTYTDYSTFVDWGTNTISNGGNTANEWFSLSVEEWTYIFNTRDNASNLRGHSTVNGVNGYVILPDGFIIPDGLSFTPVTEWGSNVYNEQQWAQMETAGAVFFPASGCRASGKNIGSVGDFGGYYSCSNVNDNNVYNMSFGTSWAGPDGVDTRCYGRSVRLVRSSLQQDAEGYYLLGSVQDWKDFATLVQTTPTANAKMTADINLGDDQTMVGTISVPYQGEFDGQGHTLTVNYNMRNEITGVAPFACVGDATIQNLHVAGSVIQQYIGAGGIVAHIIGNLTMKRCWVSAYVNAAIGTVAGIAGYCDYAGVYNKTILLEDCLFSGHIDQGDYSGGLMSHIHGSDSYNNSAQFNNCLNVGTCNNPSGSTGTFARTGTQGDPYTITNCYYKIAWRVAQGTQATEAELADGTTADSLQNNREETVWVQDPLTNQPMLAVFAGKYTVPSSGYGTFSAKAAFALPDGLEAYYCKDYSSSEGTISAVAINSVVPAEKGVLLKGTAGETYTLTTSNETPETVTDNALVAVTTQTTIQQIDGSYTNFGLSGGVFKKVNSAGGTVKANRAYLHILTSDLPILAPEIRLVWEETPTDLPSVQQTVEKRADGIWYAIDGRRLGGKPTQSGLYIVNGQKVIIR